MSLVNTNRRCLIGSGVTLSPDGDGFFTGVVTATSLLVMMHLLVTGAHR